ncbi:fasciclin-like arabinogalactan protein 14 [Selaginella moellendorffii]|uniref:fasciclin-like arabinogalactan protein 14 n=1 Tax=Selaginella moellendorffii TaxID=88036 RepID=UPI000D1C753E|nr:fasciclin-like arabinogalactan protein 14 [Selaginella moellendorffii]|eukprot:XP_024543974.1 fasciclin-like arabinogalactan protein 14 [Selaginella moellendorffii]
MRIHSLLLAALAAWISIYATRAAAKTFNITKELEGHPNFSEFNDALTESGLARSINARRSITVCVLTNSQMKSLKATLGNGSTDIKRVAAFIRPLILLTFIDPSNPHTARSINGSQQVSSMYQAAGTAISDQGIANLTRTKKGSGLEIVTAGGSNTTITKAVRTIGFDLSIVQVSNYVAPDGVVEAEDRPVVPDGALAPAVAAKAPPPPVSTDEDSSSTDDENVDSPPSLANRLSSTAIWGALGALGCAIVIVL